jgi:NAD(P)-dependent dehydrogenase (short-subunit alcohol dehydrogenase family)
MPRTWLITGSSRGFGLALAHAVLKAGDNLVATARDVSRLDLPGATLVRLDVTDPAAARAAVKLAVDTYGGLDVVVNNAGYANSAPIEDMPDAEFRAQIETNLFGVVNVTKAALPVLRSQRSGHFIQFSSVGGRVGGTPGISAYQTAKFGVEGFSEVLANEVAPFGVKVTIIEPGAFRTDWQGSSMDMADVGPDYEPSVGQMHRRRGEMAGNEPGDPVRAAQMILDVVDHPDPPRRLLHGAAALEMALASGRGRIEEAERWAEVSRSADFPA